MTADSAYSVERVVKTHTFIPPDLCQLMKNAASTIKSAKALYFSDLEL